MRVSVRSQLLLPLLALMLSVIGISAWTALASAGRARRQIERQMDDVARAVHVPFPRNRQILNLMKRMSGAEFILCDAQRKPLLDDEKHALATLDTVPDQLPEP